MTRDFIYAFKGLLRAPGFAVVAIVTLALGIGANAAVFSVVDGVLLKPLPYANPDELVMVWEHNLARNNRTNVAGPGNYMLWRDHQQSFTDMAAVFRTAVSLAEGGMPEELRAQIVGEPFFRVLGVSPVIGRAFTAQEDAPPRSKMIISDGLWRRRFNSDPAIVGRTVSVSGQPLEIVGVMPPGFQFLDRDIDVWMPIALPASIRNASGRSVRVVARLKPGVSIEQADGEMRRIAAMIMAWKPGNRGWSTHVQPLSEHVGGDLRPTLLVLLAAVGFVVLVACANVASLLLARAAARQREIAVRTALGASWLRLARQALAESITLSVLGGIAGLALAYWLLRLLLAAAARGLPIPRADEIGLDPRVLAFTALVCLVTGLLFGIAPALWARGANVTDGLKDATRGGTSAKAARARGALVVAEIALAIVLLTGAGLMLRSFAKLSAVDPGFTSENVLTFSVSLPAARYGEGRARPFVDELLGRLRALPGVTSTGAISFLPMTGLASATSYRVEGQAPMEAGAMPSAEVRVVSGDYFSAMGIPLKQGRLFSADELRERRPVMVISEAMARQAFPGVDPIGKKVNMSWTFNNFDEVIGVVGDIRHAGLGQPTRPMVYWPHVHTPYTSMNILVRTAGDPGSLAALARAEVQKLDPAQPIANVRTAHEIVSASIAQPRLVMRLLAVFAAVALVLAAVGVYGVVAYSVSQRTREIGIRMALGASRRRMIALIAGHGALLAGAGIAIGVPSALLLARGMNSMLYETPPSDPLTMTAVALVLGGSALAACLIPLRKALRIDPAAALRAE